MDSRLITVDQLSAYLNLPKATIYTWVCIKRVPADCIVKLGRALRFDLTAVDRWIEASRIKDIER